MICFNSFDFISEFLSELFYFSRVSYLIFILLHQLKRLSVAEKSQVTAFFTLTVISLFRLRNYFG